MLDSDPVDHTGADSQRFSDTQIDTVALLLVYDSLAVILLFLGKLIFQIWNKIPNLRLIFQQNLIFQELVINFPRNYKLTANES